MMLTLVLTNTMLEFDKSPAVENFFNEALILVLQDHISIDVGHYEAITWAGPVSIPDESSDYIGLLERRNNKF